MVEALRQGFISQSMSPALASFFFIMKKDSRLSIDYRGLDVVTVTYPQLLPLIPLAIDQLQMSSNYTKFDLQSAYSLVCIEPGDEWKTAISTTSAGHYCYHIMPYGSVNAVIIFPSLRECHGREG